MAIEFRFSGDALKIHSKIQKKKKKPMAIELPIYRERERDASRRRLYSGKLQT